VKVLGRIFILSTSIVMEPFVLTAKKLQVLNYKDANAEFKATFELKHLLVTFGKHRAQERFSYKKIKCSPSGVGDHIVQSDGLNFTIARSSGGFLDKLYSVLRAGVNEGTPPKPMQMSVGKMHGEKKAIKSGVQSLDQSLPVKRQFLSPVPRKTPALQVSPPSPAVSEPISSSLEMSHSSALPHTEGKTTAKDDVRPVKPKSNSMASVFRKQAPSVNTVHTASTSDEASSVGRSKAKPVDDWFEETDDLNLSGPVTTVATSASAAAVSTAPAPVPQKVQPTATTPALVRYGTKAVVPARGFGTALSFLSPAPATANRYGSGSGGASTGMGGGGTGVTDSTPRHRLFAPTESAAPKRRPSDLNSVVKRLDRDPLPVYKPPAAAVAVPAVEEEDWEGEGVKDVAPARTVPFKSASSLLNFYKSGATSGTSSSRDAVSSSSRIPGGVRNLGNSCYIGSVLQVSVFCTKSRFE